LITDRSFYFKPIEDYPNDGLLSSAYFQSTILPKSIVGAKLKEFQGLMWQRKAFQVPETHLVS
jgi:hypothetical protein